MKKTFLAVALAAISAVAMPCTAFADTPDEIIRGKVVIDEVDDISASAQQNLADELVSKFPTLTLAPSALEKETKIEIGSLPDDEVEEVIKYLNHHQGIQHAERLYEEHAYGMVNFAVPNDPLYKQQWAFQNMGIERASGFSQGRGVTVAIVDTGISCNLPDFSGVNCKSGWNFVSDDDDASDDQSHGSFCASEVAEASNNNIGAAGVGDKISLLGVKVLSSSGSGTSQQVADGIRYAAEQNVAVISLSLGGSHNSKVQEDAVRFAIDEKHCVVVAANGNSGGSIGFPAGIDGVLAISATDKNNVITDFSSRGPQTFIGAPGKDIVQQTICDGGHCPNYPTFSGTSMSTPFVAATAALLISQGVTDPDAVKSRLKSSATTTRETKSSKNNYGAGIVNAGQAVADESWHQAFWRLLFLGLLGTFAVSRKDHKWSWRFFLPALMTGVGCFFLPMLVSYPSWMTFLVSRPLLEATSLYSVKVTAWMPMVASLLPATLMVTTWHKLASARMMVAGTATGTAAYLSQQLFNGALLLPFGGYIGWIALSLNVAFCLFMARFNLKHLTSPEEKKPSTPTWDRPVDSNDNETTAT